MRKANEYVEIMDSTLRDGEQAPDVSYTPDEKLHIAKILLEDLCVDRIEVASARSSEIDCIAVKNITDWANTKGFSEKIEALAFCDEGKSADWACSVGVKVINLLTKGSEHHCRIQLRKTPKEHFKQVLEEINYAEKKGLIVKVGLEDWGSGMRNSLSYVRDFVTILRENNMNRIMLGDTLGIATPEQLTKDLNWMYSLSPELDIEFHGHDDYGMVTANSLAAVKAGVSTIHTTITGLGERAGNQPLVEIVAAINDMTERKTRVNEKMFSYASKEVQKISGKKVSGNAPIIGYDVFTQTCGVHADGDKKGNLYTNSLLPERFNRKRKYALGKLSGKASIDKNLEQMGLELDKDVRDKALQEVISRGDRKQKVTPEDLAFIVEDITKGSAVERLQIIDYTITNHKNKSSEAEVTLLYEKRELSGKAVGENGYRAFLKAITGIMKSVDIAVPEILDFQVNVSPGRKTNLQLETVIDWKYETPLHTIGVASNQLESAVNATEKMLNTIIKNNNNQGDN